MAFTSFGLHPDLLRGVKELGFTRPTAIQADAIPPALEGRDVLACAMTGSGKTAAFLLPILHRLIDRPRGKTRALVVTPTRELAAQIEQHLAELAVHTPISGAAIFGGVAMGPQEHAFRSGADILIATPGRLLDHLRHDYARLDGLEVLVLDEADRMLDMGFLPDIKRILRHLPPRRQTMLFSATMPAPITELARELQQDPARINLERRAAPAVGITQAVYPVPEDLKPELFLELLRRGDLKDVIVFTRTKHRANRLAEVLERAGVSSARIHGNRSQAQRTQALDGFKRGAFQVLVATDIVARGIDVEELSHVVNFDVPNVPEDYIHRVGRTARAEATGDAFTFVSPAEEGDLRAIERAVGRALPRIIVPGFDYSTRRAERFEIPIGERIAAIRARRAEERRRSAEKAARRSEREAGAGRGARGDGQPDRTVAARPTPRAAHRFPSGAGAPDQARDRGRPGPSRTPAAGTSPRPRGERVHGAWTPSRPAGAERAPHRDGRGRDGARHPDGRESGGRGSGSGRRDEERRDEERRDEGRRDGGRRGGGRRDGGRRRGGARRPPGTA